MTQPPATLAAACNCFPNHLILADWLEEFGQSDAAQVLRNGDMDLAELPKTGYGDGIYLATGHGDGNGIYLATGHGDGIYYGTGCGDGLCGSRNGDGVGYGLPAGFVR